MTLIISNAGIEFPDSSVQTSAPDRKLLGTINTTSGLTQTLSGLDLTSYNSLFCIFNGVTMGQSSTDSYYLYITNSSSAERFVGYMGYNYARYAVKGHMTIDLDSGMHSCATGGISGTTTYSWTNGGNSLITNASTSITFGASYAFSAGSIKIYGVK